MRPNSLPTQELHKQKQLKTKRMNKTTKLPQLDFTEAVKLSWSKLTQFTGRSRRSEFWWSYLALFIINIFMSFIPFIGSIGTLAVYLAMIPLCFRRLHDTGRSGWWYGAGIIISVALGIAICATIFTGLAGNTSIHDSLQDVVMETLTLLLTPQIITGYIILTIYGIVLLVFLCQDSQPFDNKFGPSPKYKASETEHGIPDNVPEWK